MHIPGSHIGASARWALLGGDAVSLGEQQLQMIAVPPERWQAPNPMTRCHIPQKPSPQLACMPNLFTCLLSHF